MKRLLLILLLLSNTVWAAGFVGLNYDTYVGGGPQPSYTLAADGTINNRTKLSSGVVSTINYNWGGNSVLNSGRAEGVIVRFYGFINIPVAGTYYFGGNADDGIRINVNGQSVVNSWIESGGAFRSGAINLEAGVVPIELFYYENGGGAMVNLQWYTPTDPYWQVVPSTVLATDSTYWAPATPALCCGGSSAAFTVNPVHTNRLNTFNNRGTADSRVYVEQIGNDNTITIDQSGTRNNSVTYTGNGSFNSVDITQSSTSTTATNYTEVTVNGNSNNIDLIQNSTGGTKSAFVTVSDNNNTVNINQKDSGNHYLNLNLSGGNKSADILQQGAGAHQADITLSGAGARSINLIQQGTQAQSYSINSSCTTNCQAISVTQGQ